MRRPSGLVDALLLATVFTITWTKVRWSAGAADVNISDLAASLFLFAFLLERGASRDRSVPQTAAVLALFLGAFALV